MEREEIKRRAELYSALANGKTIQYKADHGEWTDLKTDLMCGIAESFRYRIKPKYRPFKTQEECWEEMHKHPDFGFIREKGTKVIYSIAMIDNFYLSTQDKSEHLCDTMDVYEFLDGTPFGIKEE